MEDPTPTVEMAAPPSAPLARGTLVGRYVILQPIGSGAMGMVYEAVDPELERKVALKLLRPARGDAESRARLLREAQAMARLSHPNVVPIFDVGTTDHQDVFLAMERVNGKTLSEWCGTQSDWRRILRYFLYAGRGLQAAHAAGLVHRDFKPTNVLVGEDGRVRVTDFGLVRLAREAEPPPRGQPIPSGPLGSPLTRDGAIVGTPQYMSPEQLSGDKVDERSDQFSFCVALYEALYRERPFAGERLHEILAHQKLDRIREAPSGVCVPQWVRKALLRGLRSRPDERYPSLEALFAALSRDPARTWRRAGLASAAVIAVVAGGTVGVVRMRGHAPCEDAGAELRGAWNPGSRRALAARFAATKKPFASDALRALDDALSAYVERGAKRMHESCVAARVQRRTSEPARARQLACFHQRRMELSAFLKVLSGVDARTLARAPEAVSHLARFDDCIRPNAVETRVSPEQALHPSEVASLEKALAEGQAKNALGRYREALAQLDAAVQAAPHLVHTPLAAQVAEERAVSAYRLDRLRLADEGFRKAALLSEQYADDTLAAGAWIDAAKVDTELAHYSDASRLLALARAKLDRLGTPPAGLKVRWIESSAALDQQQGRYQKAADLLRRELAGGDRTKDLRVSGQLHGQLGNAENALGHAKAAASEYARAVRSTERALGPDHPALASMLGMLAGARRKQGKYDEARSLYRRALDIDEAARGPDSVPAARLLNNWALLEGDAGHPDRELDLLRKSLAVKVKKLGADHPSVAIGLIDEADTLVVLKRLPEAEDALARAAKILIAKKGPDHPQMVAVYDDLGTVQRNRGRFAAAARSFSRAVAIAEKRLGPKHPWLAVSLFGEGLNALSRRRFAPAERALERALAIDRANDAGPTDRAEVELALARALWGTRRDRPRALRLARAALAVGKKTPLPEGPSVHDMERWLQTHRLPPRRTGPR